MKQFNDPTESMKEPQSNLQQKDCLKILKANFFFQERTHLISH